MAVCRYRRISIYADRQKTLLFDAFNLETPIDEALKKRVCFPCGGYLIFDFARR